ncbi:MAG: hypothetical protein Fur0022_35620 [Anaerolineales bacterium]
MFSLKYFRRSIVILLMMGSILLFFALSHEEAHAQTSSEANVTLTPVIGLDGYCFYDRWLPVRVTLENTGADLEGRVELEIANITNAWVFSEPVQLPAVSRKEVTVFAYLYGNPNTINISFVTDQEVVTQVSHVLNCLQGGSSLIGVWAASPSAYNILTTLSFAGGRGSVAELSLADIPTHPDGLDMLSMLVISDVDTGTLSEDQRQALTHWVENGGRLVVTGGPGWQKTTSGVNTLLPFRPSGSITVSGLPGLEWVGPDDEPLTGETVITTGEIPANVIVLAWNDDNPLILRHEIGFGEVFFLAMDPALAPLRNWVGLEALYQSIFAMQLDIPSWAHGYTSWADASSAVSNVPGLGLPSIFLICGFLGLYTFALGPLNYLVLRRLKRRELAWLTVPLLVLLFSCGAMVLGLGVRGTRAVVNHLAIVQVWPEREQARVHGLIGVFSPNRSQYNVEITGNYLAHPLLDNMLGGNQAWNISQMDNGISVNDVRIDAGGIEGLALEGVTQAPEIASNVQLRFGANGSTAEGTLQNNSTITLQDTVLLGPGQFQPLGTFSPGDSLNIQMNISSSSSASQNSNTSGYPYYGYGYDTTIQDVFGTTYIGSSNYDQDFTRRFSLLQAALGYGGTRGGGIYLLGWTASSPLEVSLDGKGFKAEHTSIYIIALNPTVETNNSNLTLPPAMFTWDQLENSTNLDFSPYNSYFYTGIYQIRYRLSQMIAFKKVQSLTLHLTSYGKEGAHNLNLALWDFTTNEWSPISATDWGDTSIPDPSRFVGLGGEIRLQLENPAQSSTEFERVDFTLVVEQ